MKKIGNVLIHFQDFMNDMELLKTSETEDVVKGLDEFHVSVILTLICVKMNLDQNNDLI